MRLVDFLFAGATCGVVQETHSIHYSSVHARRRMAFQCVTLGMGGEV